MTQHSPRAVSAAAADFAISIAQLKRILGRTLSSKLELRLAESADLAMFNDEDFAKNFFRAEKKTQAISLVIARKGGKSTPVFMMVAAKASSRKTAIVIGVSGPASDARLTNPVVAKLFVLCLSVVVGYAGLTQTNEIQVRRVGASHIPFLRRLGFVIRTEGGFRHASLYRVPSHHSMDSH